MTSAADPVVGEWYHMPEKAQQFQVVAIDHHADTIEIQYFDGAVDEIEIAAWYALDVEHIEEPEDWTGPIDNIEVDNLTPVGMEMRREDWAAPYDELLEKEHAGPRESPAAVDDWDDETSGVAED
jgi:hypothetical protein